MTDERLNRAMGRLEAALDRAERASLNRSGVDTPRLIQRHERLRARMQEAVDALDRLIESG